MIKVIQAVKVVSAHQRCLVLAKGGMQLLWVDVSAQRNRNTMTLFKMAGNTVCVYSS